MTTETTNDIARQIIACGFRAFIRKGGDTYAYFTDGKSIGYIQHDRRGGYSCFTVHRPNQQTGTGYALARFSKITRDELSRAFALAPSWASSRDLSSVKKYATLAEFLKEHNWGGGLEEVSQ